MKTLFIPAKSKIDISNLVKKVKIKGKIGLISTIQFLDQLKKAKRILKNSIIAGQILGCDISAAEKIKNKIDIFLYIGSGKFHPLFVAVKTKKPVYITNPLTNEISKISESEIQEYEKKQKGKLAKFYAADKIGIIISVKPGQYDLKKALELKKKLKKESYIFVCDDINEQELENFKDIEYWINAACPRIELKNVINAEEISCSG